MGLTDSPADEIGHREFNRIAGAVSRYFGLELADLRAARDLARYRVPRKLTMFLLREMTGASYPEIGRYMRRDHTAALLACRQVQVDDRHVAELRKRLSVEDKSCARCTGLLIELASLKVEIMELSARINGCV